MLAVTEHRWVLDSGATSCATNDEADCTEVRPCSIEVTAAGTSFRVLKMGTALIQTQDEQGKPFQLRMANTLISPQFTYKLLALQPFTAKGLKVIMEKDAMRIKNPDGTQLLLGHRDKQSNLFFLPESNSQLHLARTYGSTNKSEMDLLWQLHLRHGHRNFADIARQHGLSMPKQIPACTSCIMGKAHVFPHLSSGFERAKRKAEGFHSDFRGPFSVQTQPENCICSPLLMIFHDAFLASL